MSVKDPEYVSVHEESSNATPLKLVTDSTQENTPSAHAPTNGSGPCVTLSWLQSQHYVVCPLEDKINMLYSFIKTHLKSKTIVFVSACKQCRFLHEAMRRIRPGVSVMALHGKQKQKQRSLIYLSFVRLSVLGPCSRSLSFISPLSAP